MAGSSAATGGGFQSAQSQEGNVTYDRSASPILYDYDDDDVNSVPGAGPQEGILGIKLDLYKFEARDALETTRPAESFLAQMGPNPGSRADGRNISSFA